MLTSDKAVISPRSRSSNDLVINTRFLFPNRCTKTCQCLPLKPHSGGPCTVICIQLRALVYSSIQTLFGKMLVSQMFEKKCLMRLWDIPSSIMLMTMSLMHACWLAENVFPSFAGTVSGDNQSLLKPWLQYIIYLNRFVYHFIDYPVEQKPRCIPTVAMPQRLSVSACTCLLTWYKFISKMFYLLFCLQCGKSISPPPFVVSQLPHPTPSNPQI